MSACARPALIENACMSQSPHFTGLPFANAERVIQTHANIVVLVGDLAFKLKKPVKPPPKKMKKKKTRTRKRTRAKQQHKQLAG